jgi:hypothetical protein
VHGAIAEKARKRLLNQADIQLYPLSPTLSRRERELRRYALSVSLKVMIQT